jgi:hypothetical protein
MAGEYEDGFSTDSTMVVSTSFMSSVVGGAQWMMPSAVLSHPKTRKPMSESEFFVEVKDHRGRLHSVNGAPGKKFSDGHEEFYWHGVKVPEFVVRKPEDITVGIVEAEDNAEVRRVMIERYGIQRYMADCGAVLLSKDKTGELYKKNMGQHEEPMVFVKVKNSTPEPDGSIKDYFLRVPPTTKKAIDGVAWTFGLTAKDYSPSLET